MCVQFKIVVPVLLIAFLLILMVNQAVAYEALRSLKECMRYLNPHSLNKYRGSGIVVVH